MKPKNWVYYISKFTLLDELLSFLYWGLSIYGIYFIVGNVTNSIVLIVILCLYIVSMVIVYITLLKKIKYYFKGNTE